MGDFDFLRGDDYVRNQQPYEPYQRLLTLRQLADEREYKRAQLQEARMKLAQQQRAEDERQRLQSALLTKPDMTPQEAFSIAPNLAPGLFKAVAEQQTAERQASQEQIKKNREVNQAVARVGLAASEIADPNERALFHGSQIAQLEDAGVIPKGSFGKYPIPANQQQALNRYASAYTPGDAQKYLTDKAEEARKAVEASEKSTTAGIDQAYKQAQIDALKNPKPGEKESQFEKNFFPGWLQSKGISNPTAKDRLQAWQDFEAPANLQEFRAIWPGIREKNKLPDTSVAFSDEYLKFFETKRQLAPMSPQRFEQDKELKATGGASLEGYGDPNSKLTGEAFLQTLSPAAQAEIRGIAEGRVTAPGTKSRAAGAQQKMAALMQYDPGWSEQRAAVRKSFTTGPASQNIGALNTAIVHVGRLADVGAALGSGDFTPENAAYQWVVDRFGSEAVTNFAFLKDAVAGELATALKGNATDAEIAHMGQSIRAWNSPGQTLGVVKEALSVLSDKAKTYDERYHREIPDDSIWSPILPTAKETLKRFGVPYTGSARGAVAPPPPKPDPPIGTVKEYNGQKYFYKGGGGGKPENWIKINPKK